MKDFEKWTIKILGSGISKVKNDRFLERVDLLLNSDAVLIYRGESKKRLTDKLDKYGGFPRPFVDRLFLIGDKGRNFLENLSTEVSNGVVKHSIMDTSETLFESIFTMVKDLLMKNEERISKFIKENKELSNYFLTATNKKEFVETIAIFEEDQKIKIRDYYMTLLHSFDKSAYYPISSFISTSSNEKVAKDFQGIGGLQKDRLMLYAWVPKYRTSSTYTITFDYLNILYEEMLTLELPVYFSRFFDQEEITLKGGLLPHYIIGFKYFHGTKEIFEVNPWFVHESLEENWITEGLPINQNDFWLELKKTNYNGAFYVDPNGKYDKKYLG